MKTKTKSFLIVISSYLTALRGEGGHYISAIHYYYHLKARYNVQLVVVGTRRSPAIDQAVSNTRFIELRLENCLDAGIQFAFFLRKFESVPTVLAFDEPAYLFTRLATVFIRRLRFVKIKAGGGRPNRYYTACETLIAFSGEEECWLKPLPGQATHVYSNRVSSEFLLEKQKSLPWKEAGAKRILMVCRINSAKEVYFQGFRNLLLAAHRESLPYEAIVIGSVGQNTFFDRLRAEFFNLNVTFLTTAGYTAEAYRFLADCDIAVVMGRSVPESVMLGRTVLLPVDPNGLPVRLSESSYEALRYANFSHRAAVRSEAASAADLLFGIRPEEDFRLTRLLNHEYSLTAGSKKLEAIIHRAKPRGFAFDFGALRGLPLLLRILQLDSFKPIR